MGEFTHIPVTEPWSGRSPGQGEQELGRWAIGQRYWIPSPGSKHRLGDYCAAEEMLQQESHRHAYGRINHDEPDNRYWISVDFPGMLGRLMRDYVVGRDFRLQVKGVSGDELAAGQANVDRIWDSSRFKVLMRQLSEMMPVLGDGVLKVDVEDVEDELGELLPQAVIRYVHPGHYFPEMDPLDATRVKKVTLAWVFPVASGTVVSGAMKTGEVRQTATADPYLLLREVHTSGRIEYELNAWDGEKMGEALPVAGRFPDLVDRDTGIRGIPVVHFGFQVKAGKHFGNSEVLRVTRLILALENRLSQEDEVLEKHARPKLIVGPGVLDEEARANLADFDVIEVDPDILERAVKPEYLTWDMQVGGITHQIEKLEEYLFMTTETSPASFGLERDGSQVESARALKFKAHRTINKVEDLRDDYVPRIKELFRMAQQLENVARVDDKKPEEQVVGVRVLLPDPIVEDQTQEVTDYSTLRTAGLVSRKRAVADLFDLTPEEAEAEVQEILQDQVDESAAGAVGGPPAFGGGAAGGGLGELGEV